MSNFTASTTLSGSYDNKEDFREAFNAFDWNNSGKISYSSLQVCLHVLQVLRAFTASTALTVIKAFAVIYVLL